MTMQYNSSTISTFNRFRFSWLAGTVLGAILLVSCTREVELAPGRVPSQFIAPQTVSLSAQTNLEIGSSEVTCAQYAFFLNAVNYSNIPATHGLDPHQSCNWTNVPPSLRRVLLVENSDCPIKRTPEGFAPVVGSEGSPAICVTFFGASDYCSWLSGKMGVTYRLPTEREWESAANAHNGAVKGMPGGPWEWCSDWWQPGTNFPASSPSMPENVNYPSRVIKGGEWVSTPGWESGVSKAAITSRAASGLLPVDPKNLSFRVIKEIGGR